MRIPELLAPVGGPEALRAAVVNGADAVYLGGKAFNARGYVANFSDKELEEAINYAHVRGVKVHLTLNTLVADGELEEAAAFLTRAYNLGVDAIIVQDMGIAHLARQCVPELPIHASTQMSVHNVNGAQLLKDLGFARVVLARELSLETIRRIKAEAEIEVEVFVHGALCVCYSGQCLMSSLIGGRSGNRGRCAQPCRLEYTLVDKDGRPLADPEKVGRHLLSPRDLNTLRYLPHLIEAGVDSLKIEGRAKRPEYVATVVRIYRRALDLYAERGKEGYAVSPTAERGLAQAFNRGFTSGYLYGRPGRDLMSFKRANNRGVFLGRVLTTKGHRARILLEGELAVGDGIEVWVSRGGRVGTEVSCLYLDGKPARIGGAGQVVEVDLPERVKPGDRVFKTADARLLAQAQASYKEATTGQTVPVRLEAVITAERPPEVRFIDPEGRIGRAVGAALPEKALKHPLTEASVLEQLLRLGNTPYRVDDVRLELEENVLVPFSQLNALRRAAVERLTEARLAPFRRQPVAVETCVPHRLKPVSPARAGKRLRLAVTVSSPDQARTALTAGADVVYLGGETYWGKKPPGPEELADVAAEAARSGKEVVASSPRITFDEELKALIPYFQKAVELGLPVQVGNLGSLRLAQKLGAPLLCLDWPLYSFNTPALTLWEKLGAKRVTLTPELNREQLLALGPTTLELEYLVQGQLEMMVSEFCLPGSVLGGLTIEHRCTRPCMRLGEIYLSDRKGVRFPLGCDQSCRMHIFNAMDLCLIAEVPFLRRAGIQLIRIEARNRPLEYIRQVTAAYRRVLDAAYPEKAAEQELEVLTKLSPAGITRGHFYRGVV
ncbi:MAG: family peptidase [Bacillota bacterium]|jgi:putative protease|nr:family peptidase [Bacillota bacterium]MDK2882356.1 family peptidase [Bacillota bacterium]MDK2960552.1 family peptidase [Bacillota bacterium]